MLYSLMDQSRMFRDDGGSRLFRNIPHVPNTRCHVQENHRKLLIYQCLTPFLFLRPYEWR